VSAERQLTPTRLTSRRLSLEPLRSEHADELAPLLNDSALHRFIGGTPPTPDELRVRLERQLRGRSPDGRELWLNWVARTQPEGRVVGTMQATVYPEPAGPIAMLAWTIGSAHQGQGLATEAAQLMASWLRHQGIHRLGARIHPQHRASMAVATAIGLHPTDTTVDGERQWESA
jgi:RimJ/RimL family protein N-acetyltransferase